MVHPYSVGLTLNLKVIEANDTNWGSNVILSSDSFCVDITGTFSPFTKSPVMCVTLPLGVQSPYPRCTVLKLYDCRWIDDRDSENLAWSPSREAAARTAWREKRRDGRAPFSAFDTENFDETDWEEYFRQLVQVFSNRDLEHPSVSADTRVTDCTV